MRDCCPTCGGVLPGSGMAWNRETRVLLGCMKATRFTEMEARIFDLLWRARSTGPINNKAVAQRLWSDDPDGGPVSAENIVSVLVGRIRKKLTFLPIVINSNTGPYAPGYSIAFVDQVRSAA